MPLDSYTGLVATRCLAPISLNTTNKQLMARSPHYSRTAITSLQVVLPNWYVNPASTHAELGTGADATVTASIEYPEGVFTQILFSGIASGTVPNIGQLVSDACAVTIPINTLFWVRVFFQSTGGVLTVGHDLNGGSTPGCGLEVAVSGLTDKTMSGTVTGADNEYSPVAIIGTTTNRSVVIVGDSIGLGDTTRETVGDASGDFGVVARSIGPLYAYASYCQNGDQGEDLVASHTNRVALFQYASDLICEYGNNDVWTISASVAAVQSTLQTIWSYMTDLGPEKKAYQTTITTRTTSTDNWATTTNQTTASSANEGRRLTLNAWLRALPTGLNGCFDITTVLETGLGTGLWIVNGAANAYTSDGTHPNTTSSILIRNSGVVRLPLDSADGGGGVMTDAAGPSGGPFSQGGTGVLTTAAGPV